MIYNCSVIDQIVYLDNQHKNQIQRRQLQQANQYVNHHANTLYQLQWKAVVMLLLEPVAWNPAIQLAQLVL